MRHNVGGNQSYVVFYFSNGRIRRKPTKFDPEEMRNKANALFRAEQSQDLRDVIAEKIEDLRHYDFLTLDRAVAICNWGRSGSLLVASYFDGHEDVISLPLLCSHNLYLFFDRYSSLPLRDKLLAFAAFEQALFSGDFAISTDQYYVAVQAVLEFYGKQPPEFLESRRTFFLFVHIAYNLALGRGPATSQSLIVYPQHLWNDQWAEYLVEDFPKAKFIHTIRDPIALVDRGVDYWLGGKSRPREPLQNSEETRLQALEVSAATPWYVLNSLVNKDRPHSGVESRTQTVRFEDLHADTAKTMHDLADWLGLSWQATLLESTFNGIPYVVSRDGKSWSGKSSEQAQRHAPRNISLKDRGLLYALFYENFVAWAYPCPKVFRSSIVRCIVFSLLFLFPTQMEILVARAVFRRNVRPAIRHGKLSILTNSLAVILLCRLAVIWLLVPEFCRRLAGRKTLLHADDRMRHTGPVGVPPRSPA